MLSFYFHFFFFSFFVFQFPQLFLCPFFSSIRHPYFFPYFFFLFLLGIWICCPLTWPRAYGPAPKQDDWSIESQRSDEVFFLCCWINTPSISFSSSVDQGPTPTS